VSEWNDCHRICLRRLKKSTINFSQTNNHRTSYVSSKKG
jgi:hypothetical protein